MVDRWLPIEFGLDLYATVCEKPEFTEGGTTD